MSTDGVSCAPARAGWQELRAALLAAGANPTYASEPWACNHYRWVVWKLARLELAHACAACGGGAVSSTCASRGCARGRLLTAGIALDELKYR